MKNLFFMRIIFFIDTLVRDDVIVVDPTGIANVTLTGINIPIRIAEATVLPDAIVLGKCGGVIFSLSHFAQADFEKWRENQE